jgi:hypothetical protein
MLQNSQPFFLEFVVAVEMLGVLFANLCLRALKNEGVCGFRGFVVIAGVYLCDAITAEHGCESNLVGGISSCMCEVITVFAVGDSEPSLVSRGERSRVYYQLVLYTDVVNQGVE